MLKWSWDGAWVQKRVPTKKFAIYSRVSYETNSLIALCTGGSSFGGVNIDSVLEAEVSEREGGGRKRKEKRKTRRRKKTWKREEEGRFLYISLQTLRENARGEQQWQGGSLREIEIEWRGREKERIFAATIFYVETSNERPANGWIPARCR